MLVTIFSFRTEVDASPKYKTRQSKSGNVCSAHWKHVTFRFSRVYITFSTNITTITNSDLTFGWRVFCLHCSTVKWYTHHITLHLDYMQQIVCAFSYKYQAITGKHLFLFKHISFTELVTILTASFYVSTKMITTFTFLQLIHTLIKFFLQFSTPSIKKGDWKHTRVEGFQGNYS